MSSPDIPISELPEPLLAQITAVLHSFSTALIKIFRNARGREEGNLIGSGTFVSVGNIYGVLTAHHVTELLERNDLLGLILVPEEHRNVIPVEHISIVKIARGPVEAEGPDLSFIVLPSVKVSEVKHYKQFFNVSRYRDDMLNNPPEHHQGVWFVCGMSNEMTIEETSAQGTGRVKSLAGLCGAGGANREYVSGDFDYIEVDVEYHNCTELPQTFGGVSGGGLWQVPVRIAADERLEPADYILSGTAFYQSELRDRKRFIKCHGRRSIYKNFHDRVVETCS